MGRMFDALQKIEQGKGRDDQHDVPKINPEDIILDTKLVSYYEPNSLAAEQFRRLKAYMIKAGADKALKTILITSALTGEGKSLVAINLAITIASELHCEALLIDCDLRNPSLSRWFGFQEGQGLSNYLLGEADLSDLVIRTSIDKLSILPSGLVQGNPVELIGSRKMKCLIENLKGRDDDRFIILDSSPLLATTEPGVLNELVDGIVLVIKSNATPRESVQQALKSLDAKKIMGVVLNDQEFQTKALKKRYYGTHRYHYEDDYMKLRPEPNNGRKFTFLGKLFPIKKG